MMTMLGSETNRKLRDMGAACLIGAIEAQDDETCMGMTLAERMQMAVDEAHSAFVEGKVGQLIKRAHLRYPNADVRRIDFSEERNLDRVRTTELATCGYVERGSNVVLQGFTGSGKSFLACALAKEACKRRMRTCYILDWLHFHVQFNEGGFPCERKGLPWQTPGIRAISAMNSSTI